MTYFLVHSANYRSATTPSETRAAAWDRWQRINKLGDCEVASAIAGGPAFMAESETKAAAKAADPIACARGYHKGKKWWRA